MRKLLLLFLLCALAAPASAASTRYVDASRPDDTGDGLSWATAHKSLTTALSAATAGDHIWVASGTYKPTTTATDREASFRMKQGVEIYGGFTSGQMNLGDRNRDPATNRTILSGDIDGDGTRTGNSYHVINNEGANLTSIALLDGFMITGGNADDPTSSDVFGAGMYNVRSSPRITNCLFQGNAASEGGAIYNSESSPQLSNCSFVTNSAPYGTLFGGSGGGMVNKNGSNAQVRNCTFNGNSAAIGGAIYNEASSPQLINCTLNSNTAFNGGAISNRDNSAPRLVNCSLQRNNANRQGGAVANIDSSPIFVNCSFQGNTAISGGAMYNVSSPLNDTRPSLTNCVFWNNGDANTFFNFTPLLTGITQIFAAYTLFDESVTGYRSLLDPNFTTLVSPFASATDTRLRAGSPAIDAGLNTVNSTSTDLAGNSRIIGGTIDLGAYEDTELCPDPPTLTVTPGTTTTGAPITVTATGCTGILEFLISGPGIGRRSGDSYTISDPGTFRVTALCTKDGCTRAATTGDLVIGTTTPPPGDFAITGVSGVSCTEVPGEAARNLTFTPTYAGADGSPITFDVQSELVATTAPGPYTIKLYLDNPSINLRASQDGGTRVSYRYDWLAACGTAPPPVDPPVPGEFAITGVSGVSCTEVPGEAARNLTFTPTYAGTDGSPITFDVQSELVATTIPGPYTIKLYLDNPSINLRASQGGRPQVSFRYGWLAACGASSSRLGAERRTLAEEPDRELQVTLLGNPTGKGQVEFEVRGAQGQRLDLQLLDFNGRAISRQSIEKAGVVERQTLGLGAGSGGMLILRVSTATQSQTVKVLDVR
ncbi:choice-of-anchor Q domain-containing protein [Persicitalea sp.]|uniref:choice-of-anchor Q domain-containing protein n=1 Tax=Persicitalea sp. TaxID=3100273 RepID=UPI0035936EE8